MNTNVPFNQHFFNNISNNFDEHVRQSIPLYEQYFDSLVDAISEPNSGIYSVLDICGSTGELGRKAFLSGYKGYYTSIDGSPQMIEYGNFLNSINECSSRIKNKLCGFMSSWIDESGVKVPLFESKHRYDIVVENLGFQFFTQERDKEIAEVKSMLYSDGLFVTCEKLKRRSDLWNACEYLKDTLHKSKSFTNEQIKDKKEKVLNSMGDYLVNQMDYVETLNEYFKYVVRIYQAGNFAGYICSDSRERVLSFKKHFGHELICNKFNPWDIA